MNTDIAKAIKSKLRQHGVKQKHIAISLGVSAQAVNQVVLGSRFTFRIKKAIADAIGKPVSEIWPDQTKTNEAA